jgi:hypothetical protein
MLTHKIRIYPTSIQKDYVWLYDVTKCSVVYAIRDLSGAFISFLNIKKICGKSG